jgi:hypothetical protein
VRAAMPFTLSDTAVLLLLLLLLLPIHRCGAS